MLAELEGWDWASVFGEEANAGNTGMATDSGDGTPVEPLPTREMVSNIIAMAEGERDGDAWVGLFELNDGRFLVASGSCDYTGWD